MRITFESKHDETNSCIWIYDNEEIIGRVGWGQHNHKSEGYPLSYHIQKEYRNKGLISQALALFISETQLSVLQACVMQNNIASLRVMQKAGFKQIHEYEGHDGTLVYVFEKVLKVA